MQIGKRGMGNHKHAISGFATRSPRYKFLQRLEANKPKKKRKPNKQYVSVNELVKDNG